MSTTTTEGTAALAGNPLLEEVFAVKTPDPCILVIFGATGDLTARKLIPALFNLSHEGQLPAHFACVGFARREKSHEQFRAEMRTAIDQFSRTPVTDQRFWDSFANQLFYHTSEFHEDAGYEALGKFLKQLDVQFGTKGNRLYYLSTPSGFFPVIIEKLKKHDLIYPVNNAEDRWSRVIIEKPFGHDLDSAIELQKEVSQFLDESQTYRIDHWLGKETVQNLLIFRFTNPIFESMWNNHFIDHVQITVGEDIGVGSRGSLWEESGMLRDIVQNHMMQLLSLIGMEPPANLSASSIHDEKVKVIQSIRPFSEGDLIHNVVRGQYGPGFVNGEAVKGYRQEDRVSPTSNVETYTAFKLWIDNWRWSGVPFYLRAGKRMPKKVTEIAITFKPAPGTLYQMHSHICPANVLALRIQPNEGISLKMNCKIPGQEGLMQPVKMDFHYNAYFGATQQEAYERLICDCMSGDATLFARNDEVISSWKIFTPVLDWWKQSKASDFPNYASGSWGPPEADALMHADDRTWRVL